MTLQTLLQYAESNPTPYFTPGTEIQVFIEIPPENGNQNDSEGEWVDLLGSPYSLKSLAEGLSTDNVQHDIRFASETAEAYLEHLAETGIGDTLHYDPRVNQERLVAFADNGYTTIQDFHQRATPLDIERDTGVPEETILEIATAYLDGFSSAGEIDAGGPLTETTPKDTFTGWELAADTPHQIRWISAGKFNLTISPQPDESITLTSNVPVAENSPYLRKGWKHSPHSVENLSPKEAVEEAHQWLAANQLEFDDDLAQFPQIGAVTKDYLALEYDITSTDDLRNFIENSPETFEEIFAGHSSTLRDSVPGA